MGGFLVILVLDGFVEFGFEAFAGRHRAFALDFLQPKFEGLNFTILFGEVQAAVLAIERADFLQARLNQTDDVVVTVAFQGSGAFGPNAHHQALGTKLLQGPGQIFRPGIFLDEIENLEIAFGVLDGGVEFLKLEKANVAVMILDEFLLQTGAIFRSQSKFLVVAGMLAFELVKLVQVILVKRFAAKGAFAIRPAFGIHLQETEIDAQLDFFLAILAHEFSDDNLPWLIIPLIQQGRYIETHCHTMDFNSLQVNALAQVQSRLGQEAPAGQSSAMSNLAQVAVHPSVFPGIVERDLRECLRNRRIDPKFHYVTYKQAARWLAVHEAYSPARIDPDGAAVYERAFAGATEALGNGPVRLIGLGCGGGQKDARMLIMLQGQGRELAYVPSDISLALVLTAARAAQNAVSGIPCHPVLCDLAHTPDLAQAFRAENLPKSDVITFFGMIPNLEPEMIMPRLAGLVRAQDLLLFSANLAPGPDYAAGVKQVLHGYDNPETRDWLGTFLYDLGIEQGDGSIEFSIEDAKIGLKRIVADFCFTRPRILTVSGERFEFTAGEKIRLFFSYRYTPERVLALLARHRLSILGQWITPSGEEGVFLCRRNHG